MAYVARVILLIIIIKKNVIEFILGIRQHCKDNFILFFRRIRTKATPSTDQLNIYCMLWNIFGTSVSVHWILTTGTRA